MVFLAFCDAGANGAIAGVNLRDKCTQVVVTISLSGQMLQQIPDLTAHNSAVKVKYLKNILLGSTPPRKPRLAETDVASLTKLQSADAVLVARCTIALAVTHLYHQPRPETQRCCDP
jgi:hypothetical protein